MFRWIACPLLLTGVITTSACAQTVAVAPVATTEGYLRSGAAELARLQAIPRREGRARNVVILIGDGMGISTLTAARIHDGQRRGVDGESFVAAMDRLDHAALVKTYSHDYQVSDSAPTATAILAGIKTRNSVIGLGPEVAVDDCAGSRGREVTSLFAIAQREGLATGIIATARITHATPAAAFAHTPQRDWEADGDLDGGARVAGCLDIARQLVEGPVGRELDLVLGGGRSNFLPATMADPEYPDQTGRRTDGRDLTAEWRRLHPRGTVAFTTEQFAAAAPDAPLLGLFEPSHMQYEADRARDPGGEPSIAEMTAAAIARLSRTEAGYVLLVEAGRIDHAHHAGNARRALEDTIAFDEAVAHVIATVDLDETLVIVTADHSHSFTMSGYPARGNPMLGLVAGEDRAPARAGDGLGYTTLGYANGPGAVTSAPRPDPAATDPAALDYKQQALVPLGSETHAGEDVVVRASGPMAHLFAGTIEQHTIFHIIRAAMAGPAD